MEDGGDNEDTFHVSDFILPHQYFILPTLRLMLFVKIIRGSVWMCPPLRKMLLHFPERMTPSAEFLSLDQLCPPSKIILLKALTQDLKEDGFFFSVTASLQRGTLPWVSWLHISRINELIWKTNSFCREGTCFSLCQIHFHSHIHRVRELRGLMLLNLDVKLCVKYIEPH